MFKKKVHVIHWVNAGGFVKTYCGIYVNHDQGRPVWSDEINCKSCAKKANKYKD